MSLKDTKTLDDVTDHLLTTEEAAVVLRVKPWTLRSWVSQKKIPYVKLGRLVRFDPNALKEFVIENTIEPVSCNNGK